MQVSRRQTATTSRVPAGHAAGESLHHRRPGHRATGPMRAPRTPMARRMHRQSSIDQAATTHFKGDTTAHPRPRPGTQEEQQPARHVRGQAAAPAKSLRSTQPKTLRLHPQASQLNQTPPHHEASEPPGSAVHSRGQAQPTAALARNPAWLRGASARTEDHLLRDDPRGLNTHQPAPTP